MASFNLKEIACKLCLEPILDKNFEVIDDLMKNILDNLLLRLKFHEGHTYVICSYCREKLDAALEFKSTCMNNDNTIISYVDCEKMLQLDLREVYKMEKKNQQSMSILDDQKVCRLCMQLIGSDFRYIHKEEIDTIQKFVPEMNINIVKDPVICKQCFDSLNTHNYFLKRCVEVDETIEQICDISSTECKTFDALSLDLFVKTENLKEGPEINEIEMSLKAEPVDIESDENEEPKINEIGMSLKTEPIDIKSEENKEWSDTSHCSDELSDVKIKNEGSTNLYDSKQKIPKSKMQFTCHQIKHEDFSDVQIYKCDKCDYNSKHKSYLKKHQLTHKDFSEVQIYKCDKCDHKTKHKSSLIRHQLQHKDISEVQMYKCDTCDFQTKYKINLLSHQLKHKDLLKVQVYQCDACEYRTKSKNNLKKHFITHKDISEVQVYQCDACEYRAKRKGNLKKHQLKHKDFSDVKVYKCDACNYNTKRKSCLIRHQLKHKDFSEVQVYKCDACDFKTKHKNSLTNHQLQHKDSSEVEVFKCHVCGYKATCESRLKRHLIVHKDFSEMELYKCDACDFKTKHKNSLKQHQRAYKKNL